MRYLIHLSLLLSIVGCESFVDPSGERPVGLGETRRAGGPVVVWDLEHKPLPEIPLPNDQATRLDPTSPTGRRLNIGRVAETRYEERTRQRFNRLDGFGAYAPITVRFDGPLDLPSIVARQRDNDDFRDDAVFLLNVDPVCERFGEEIAIDFGRGRFPATLMSRSVRVPDPEAPGGYRLDESGNKLFDYDPQGESLTILFSDKNEDENGNGDLDDGEDLNGNGVLDPANFVDPGACDGVPESTPDYDRCVADNLMNWYERATNTLILKPLWPLEERCTHAVVMTRRLLGANGRPVESPFPAVQPADQIDALAPVAGLLPRYGLSNADVAFAWSFTVGTMTRDVEVLRKGIHGHGPMARLAEEFPVSEFDVWTRNQWRALSGDPPVEPDTQLLRGGCLTAAFAELGGTGDGDKQICGGYADFASVGGIFAGRFAAPSFLVDRDGHATESYPADEDEVWDVEPERGRAVYGRTEVTFWCALPREDARPAEVECNPGNPEGRAWCKPYPVVFYTHGYGGFKGEFVLHAGRHTQMGFAGCGLDSFGHGGSIAFDPFCPGGLELQAGRDVLRRYGVPELISMVFYGRDRDLNNDGCSDSGADQWTASVFHTRDVVRQSVIEEMQFVRMLHAMDGNRLDSHGRVLGDVDGDGEPDIGGATNIVTAWGISLGGQLLGVLAGAEPALDAVSPNAVGAGLTEISVRLGQGGLAEAVMLPTLGPLMVGCLPVDEHQNPLSVGASSESCIGELGSQQAGELILAWYAHDNAKLAVRPFARVPGVEAGDIVVIENLDKRTRRETIVGARGWFRGSIAADALSPIARRSVLGMIDGDRLPIAYEDTPTLGDRIRVSVLESSSRNTKAVIDEWEWDVSFQGTTYPAGAPLVAMQEGLGYRRNTPEFRRFYSIAQHAVNPADPAVWARRYRDDPIQAPYDPAWWPGRSHVMVMPTVGDPQVPIATGVALGRAAGLLGSWDRAPDRFGPEHGWRELFVPDPRYGKSIDQWLVDNYVVEGDWRMQRFAGYDANPNVLFDPDDVSDGTARFSCLHEDDWSAKNGEFHCPVEIDDEPVWFGVPHPEPGGALRRDRPLGDGSFDALRIPLLRPAGQHGIYNPQPFRPFDADAYMVSFTARYFATRGRDLSHEPGCDCAYVQRPSFVVDGQPVAPGIEDIPTCPDDEPAYGKPCTAACAAAWGFVPIPPTVCNTAATSSQQ